MFHSRESLRPLFLLAALLPLACAQQEESASAEVVVALHQALSSSDVAKVSVEVTANDITPMVTQLTKSGSQWVGIVGAIPAGADRTFKVEAKDASGSVVYAGAAAGVTIAANQQAVVSILAQQKSAPAAFDNAAPRIDSVVVSTAKPGKGDKVHLTATAHDPNTGDVLTFAWKSTAGTFDNAAALETDWNAPAAAGQQTLTLTVTDPKGAVAATSFSINVVESSAQGTASLTANVNTWPEIEFVRASPSRVDVGQATVLQLSVKDVDGDAIGYNWSADCGGTFSDPASRNPSFTPSSAPVSGVCTLQVDVRDFRGGTNVGRLGIHVAPALVANFAPSIDLTFQSVATASGNNLVVFRVGASDPEGGAITIDWTTSAGSLSSTNVSPGLSEAQLVAPSCADFETVEVVATAKDAQGASTKKKFSLRIVNCQAGINGNLPVASCAQLKRWVPTAGSAVYFLGTVGNVYQAMCEMQLDGGGWTVFYAGQAGSANATQSFNAGGTCTSAVNSCVRRLPANIPSDVWLAATCTASGTNAVKFRPSAGVLALFRDGTASGWQPVTEATALSAKANVNLVSELWTGDSNTPDFALRGSAGAFMNGSPNPELDFCNGTAVTGGLQWLMYR